MKRIALILVLSVVVSARAQYVMDTYSATTNEVIDGLNETKALTPFNHQVWWNVVGIPYVLSHGGGGGPLPSYVITNSQNSDVTFNQGLTVGDNARLNGAFTFVDGNLNVGGKINLSASGGINGNGDGLTNLNADSIVGDVYTNTTGDAGVISGRGLGTNILTQTFSNAVSGIISSAIGQDIFLYNSTNISGITNANSSTNYLWSTNIPASFSRSFTLPAVGSYLSGTVYTNVTSILGNIQGLTYVSATANGPGPGGSCHTELYYSTNNGATLLGDWDGNNLTTLTVGGTNSITAIYNNPPMQFNPPAMLFRFVKMDTSSHINVSVLGGTNNLGYLHLMTQATSGSTGGTFNTNNPVFTGSITIQGTNANNGWQLNAINNSELDVNGGGAAVVQLFTNGSAFVIGSLTASNLTLSGTLNQVLQYSSVSNVVINEGNVYSFQLPLTNNVVFQPITNAVAGSDFRVDVIQGSNPWTVTFNTNYTVGNCQVKPPVFGQIPNMPTNVGAHFVYVFSVLNTGTNAVVSGFPAYQ